MEIKPLFDRVLLKPYNKSQSHTLITPTENEGNKMEIVELGTSTNFIVKTGDIVIINKYTGSEFVIQNQKFTLIKECDILAILKEDTK